MQTSTSLQVGSSMLVCIHLVFMFHMLLSVAQVASLPFERPRDEELGNAFTRARLYVGDYAILLSRNHYALLEELAKRAPASNTPGSVNGTGNVVPGADYYNKQNPTVQKQLSDHCDVADHASNTHQEELIFTNPSYSSQTDTQVQTTLAKQCYQYQDKTEPQYSDKACGHFDNNGTQPKCSGEFFGGRVPGTSGSNSVYSASCEINKVSSPKYFGTISDNERNKLITNVNGNNGQFTSQFINAHGGQPYKGSTDFCKNVP